MTRFPDFLIIGAMKAGTTTLYDDLRKTPGVYLPPEKEPEDLAFDTVLSPEGTAAYARKFKAAPADSLCGEASTAYSKFPQYGPVETRAMQVIGPQLKIVYILRDPIKRILSQYRHLVGLGLEDRPLDQAVREDPSYIDISRYGYQLTPWQAVIPPENIYLLSFEGYLADRKKSLHDVRTFLGLRGEFSFQESHLNASEGKRVVPQKSPLRSIMKSRAYLYGVKPLLNNSVKSAVKNLILPKAKNIQKGFNETENVETLAFLHAALRDDTLAGPLLKPNADESTE